MLTFYYLLPIGLRNQFLLAASLFLYAWGEGRNAAVLPLSIALNYWFGMLIGRTISNRRALLFAGVAANLLLLMVFKYAGFLAQNINYASLWVGFHAIAVPRVRLPAGLSFYTFMAISYLVDIYRRDTEAETKGGSFALYLSMFPHLIAGPIVRFSDISGELHRRTATIRDRAEGARRFVIGLGKKILIANTVAQSADAIFAQSASGISAPVAWLGVLCYTIQIYFDFSGYSDMAIGLARMFGFHFPENFNFPYISTSIAEFWRRWHISLSTWLRDYLFFPLGVRKPRLVLYRNTLIVFLLCGLWHGAAWHYVIWGLFHGVFLVLERTGPGALLLQAPKPLRHAYTLLVVMIGWVFFRSASILDAGSYLATMAGFGSKTFESVEIARSLPLDVGLALAAGIVASVPFRLPRLFAGRAAAIGEFAFLAGVLVASLAGVSAQTYMPFIYFRF